MKMRWDVGKAGGAPWVRRAGLFIATQPLCTVLHFRKGNNLLHFRIGNTLRRAAKPLADELPLHLGGSSTSRSGG